MKAINITVYTEDPSQIEAIKAVIKALKIKYKITDGDDTGSLYDPEFIEMIRQGEKDIKEGKGIKMTLGDLESLYK